MYAKEVKDKNLKNRLRKSPIYIGKYLHNDSDSDSSGKLTDSRILEAKQVYSVDDMFMVKSPFKKNVGYFF